jgi:ATP-dependent RNA helicase DeaD
MSESAVLPSFSELGLSDAVVAALKDVGYETPTPIQAQTIPALLGGADLLGQAQTGTGKTAAFALPILSKIDVELRATQALVLAPTRELAIQVPRHSRNTRRRCRASTLPSMADRATPRS